MVMGRMPAVVAVLAVVEGADLPEDVLALLDHHHLDSCRHLRRPEADDPIQYDELRIEHDQGDVVRNQHGRRNEAVASRQVSEVAGHGRLATVRQEASLVRSNHREA